MVPLHSTPRAITFLSHRIFQNALLGFSLVTRLLHFPIFRAFWGSPFLRTVIPTAAEGS